jgi:hypothetical protein
MTTHSLPSAVHEIANYLSPIAHAAYIIRAVSAKNPRVEQALDVIDRQIAGLRRLLDDTHTTPAPLLVTDDRR